MFYKQPKARFIITRDETLQHSRIAGQAAADHEYVARVKVTGGNGLTKWRYFYSQAAYDAYCRANRNKDSYEDVVVYRHGDNEKTVVRNTITNDERGRTHTKSMDSYFRTGSELVKRVLGVFTGNSTDWHHLPTSHSSQTTRYSSSSSLKSTR